MFQCLHPVGTANKMRSITCDHLKMTGLKNTVYAELPMPTMNHTVTFVKHSFHAAKSFPCLEKSLLIMQQFCQLIAKFAMLLYAINKVEVLMMYLINLTGIQTQFIIFSFWATITYSTCTTKFIKKN